MTDFFNKYNTPLSRKAQGAFQNWVQRESAKSKRNILRDKEGYDIQGFFVSGYERGGHGPDLFKKPNHDSFSDESIFEGLDGYKGGKWGPRTKKHPDGSFTASRRMLETTHTRKGLKRYFGLREPGVKLILPEK